MRAVAANEEACKGFTDDGGIVACLQVMRWVAGGLAGWVGPRKGRDRGREERGGSRGGAAVRRRSLVQGALQRPAYQCRRCTCFFILSSWGLPCLPDCLPARSYLANKDVLRAACAALRQLANSDVVKTSVAEHDGIQTVMRCVVQGWRGLGR